MIKERGITLIALVVTIIILLILSGIALNFAIGEKGLFSQAQRAVGEYKNSAANEDTTLQEATKIIEDLIQGNGGENPPQIELGPNGKQLVTSATTTNHETIEAEDKLGNPVTVPGGFKVAEGEKVEDGIVIEDEEGNQFVWIPVSNVDGDNNAETNPDAEDLIKIENGKTVEITLGRYKFDDSTGKPKLKQTGLQCTLSESEGDFAISTYFIESTADEREEGSIGAKNLEDFVKSVKINQGYYLARYEASFGSEEPPTRPYKVDGERVTSIMTTQKPAIKPTKKDNDTTVYYNDSETSIEKGDLWVNITQADSSKVSQNMYAGNKYVESDLVNSYAWDTAIVFIEKMEESNYANQGGYTGSSDPKNTGDTGDVKCNIYDMAGNLMELTTEYSKKSSENSIHSCCVRGGYYGGSHTSSRNYMKKTDGREDVGFRPILYFK